MIVLQVALITTCKAKYSHVNGSVCARFRKEIKFAICIP